jgi:hypothetical protein
VGYERDDIQITGFGATSGGQLGNEDAGQLGGYMFGGVS